MWDNLADSLAWIFIIGFIWLSSLDYSSKTYIDKIPEDDSEQEIVIEALVLYKTVLNEEYDLEDVDEDSERETIQAARLNSNLSSIIKEMKTREVFIARKGRSPL